MNTTLGIIKPDAYQAGHSLAILKMIEAGGLSIEKKKIVHLTQAQAEDFYHVHHDKAFFYELVEYMSAGPIMVLCISGEKCIERYRNIIGATDPQDAAEGTIRKTFGVDKGKNAVHGSDNPTNALKELAFFFE